MIRVRLTGERLLPVAKWIGLVASALIWVWALGTPSYFGTTLLFHMNRNLYVYKCMDYYIISPIVLTEYPSGDLSPEWRNQEPDFRTGLGFEYYGQSPGILGVRIDSWDKAKLVIVSRSAIATFCSIAAVPAAFAVAFRFRRARRRTQNRCQWCGYSQNSQPHDLCTECGGKPLSPDRAFAFGYGVAEALLRLAVCLIPNVVAWIGSTAVLVHGWRLGEIGFAAALVSVFAFSAGLLYWKPISPRRIFARYAGRSIANPATVGVVVARIVLMAITAACTVKLL